MAEIEEKHLLMTFLLFLVGIPTWAVVVVEFWSTWNLDIYDLHIDMGLSLYMYGCMRIGTVHMVRIIMVSMSTTFIIVYHLCVQCLHMYFNCFI